ncbi:MAG: tryptophan synthase subunit beta [Acidimicrobiales bacterium]
MSGEGLMARPGPDGRFGEFGGRFVPESLMPACLELEKWFDDAWADPAFRSELDELLRHYGGRPTPVTECRRLSQRLGVRVLLKREDLAHTGSHKLNNVVGQALLTMRMDKTRMIAETGAGQHGVAAATAAALFGLECTVFMGEVDTKRQELNVFRMELLGATVVPVTSGSRTLKDAVNEAMREWVATVEYTHYCLGSVMGPHPFPYMVRQLQRVVGDEARRQSREILDGADPDVVVACIGGGSNAAGTFAGFVDTEARLVGVEAAGGAAVTNGIPGVLHGMHSRLLQDEVGQIMEAYDSQVTFVRLLPCRALPAFAKLEQAQEEERDQQPHQDGAAAAEVKAANAPVAHHPARMFRPALVAQRVGAGRHLLVISHPASADHIARNFRIERIEAAHRPRPAREKRRVA